MKKLCLFSLVSLLFLLPLNVKADTDFYTGSFTWKYSNNATIPIMTDSQYQIHTSYNNGDSTPYQNYSMYLQNVGLGAFDYALISTYIETDNNLYYSSTCATNLNCYYDDGPSYNVSILYHRSNNVQYEAPCQLISSSGVTAQFGLWKCPIGINATTFDGIHFSVFDGNNYQGTSGLKIGANKWATFHYTDSTSSNISTGITQQTQAINNMSSNISDMNDTMSDMNDTMTDINDAIQDSSVNDAQTDSNSFFSNFSTEANGHLTQIITAPLSLFSAMTDTCTQPITLNLSFPNFNARNNANIQDKTITLPCGTTLFWENTSFVGDNVANFRVFWNMLLGGPLIYGCLVILMKAFNDALDPLNDALITAEGALPETRSFEEEGQGIAYETWSRSKWRQRDRREDGPYIK